MSANPATIPYRWDEDCIPMAIACLNGEGGHFWVHLLGGVEDGLHRLKEKLRQRIVPNAQPFIDCVEILSGSLATAEVRICSGADAPYYDRDAGMEQGVWLEGENGPRRAEGAEVLDMIRRADGPHYEECRSLCQNLTLEKLKAAFQRRKLSFGRPQQVTLGLVGSHGLYTNLAFILSDQRQYTAQLRWVEGWGPAGRLLDQAEAQGSFMDMTEQIWQVVDRWNGKRAAGRKHSGVEWPDFTRETVEEVFNLLPLMMDFSREEPNLLILYEDRMVLQVAGGPPEEAAYSGLLSGQSPYRNRRLCTLLERLYDGGSLTLGVTQLGSLYRRMAQWVAMEYDGAWFRMAIPSMNAVKRVKPPDRYGRNAPRAIALLAERRMLTRDQVAEALGILPRQAAFLLNRMAREGLLSHKSRSSVYLPGPQAYLPEQKPGLVSCAVTLSAGRWR